MREKKIEEDSFFIRQNGLFVTQKMSRRIAIVIEGGVGAGKTVLFEKLKSKFGDNVCFLEEPYFGFVELRGKSYSPLKEMYENPIAEDNYVCTQEYITKRLGEHYMNGLRNTTVTIMDRWIRSCEYFIRLRREIGLITDFTKDFLLDHVDKLQAILDKELEKVVVYRYLLKTPPEQCAENVFKRGRQEEVGCLEDFWIDFNERFYKLAERFGGPYHLIGSSEVIEVDICKLVKRHSQ